MTVSVSAGVDDRTLIERVVDASSQQDAETVRGTVRYAFRIKRTDWWTEATFVCELSELGECFALCRTECERAVAEVMEAEE